MKITVYENGDVTPAGAAALLSQLGATSVYVCSHCEKEFAAPIGQVTTHECDQPKR